MRRIDGTSLWVGNARDARDIKAVLDAGIEAIVDLAMMCEPVRPTRELVSLRFPLVDGGGNPLWLIRAAVHAVEGLARLEVPTLVACDGGMSRSPAVAAVAICLATDQRAPDMVLLRLQHAAPSDVHPALWNDIVRCWRGTDEDVAYRGPR